MCPFNIGHNIKHIRMNLNRVHGPMRKLSDKKMQMTKELPISRHKYVCQRFETRLREQFLWAINCQDKAVSFKACHVSAHNIDFLAEIIV